VRDRSIDHWLLDWFLALLPDCLSFIGHVSFVIHEHVQVFNHYFVKFKVNEFHYLLIALIANFE
jgi:hypothetical protein